MTKIEKLACNLLNSNYNNGFGIQCHAVTKICQENNVEFKDLWIEVIKQGQRDEDNY